MKLLSKINRSYFKYGILVFLFADVIIILLINFILKVEIDQQLKLEVSEIIETITNKGDFQDIYPTAIVKVIEEDVQSGQLVKDTVIYDTVQDKFVPFREYSETKTIAGKNYQIITRQMLMEFDDLFILYASLISIVLLFIFFGIFVFARRFNARIWETFNDDVKSVKAYSFDSPFKLNLAQTGIDEFDELNLALTRMSDRLERDYRASREFSANAAHEIQTPLAIIRNKCETLFSNPGLSEGTISTLRDIYLSADKLSGTIKALLLLAKIDHGQFNENDPVSFNELFRNWIDSFHDVILDRKLSVSIAATDNCQQLMDKRLANLLIQNIFINAIKHSSDGEKIEIFLSKDQFQLSNHGEKPIEHPEKIFNAFYKESQNNTSTGIGLAIVKKIADHYQMKIAYSFNDFKHFFTFRLRNC